MRFTRRCCPVLECFWIGFVKVYSMLVALDWFWTVLHRN